MAAVLAMAASTVIILSEADEENDEPPPAEEVRELMRVHPLPTKEKSSQLAQREKKEKPAPTRKKAKKKQEQPKENKHTFTVTAYTAGPESTGKSPGDKGYGITASGKQVQAGVTLACPKSLPFGTKVRIDGLGERVCHDRGGAITEGKLDVYMPTVSEARQFGRKQREVIIVEE